MISFTFKFVFYFSISFLILSFRIGEAPIFNHLYKYMGPFGKKSYEKIVEDITETYNRSKSIGKKFIQNSSKDIKDQIQTKNSSIQKELKKMRNKEEIVEENILAPEREELNKIIAE